MAAIDFPSAPTVGQQFTAAGLNWVWDGTKWVPAGLGTGYLPLSGGTLTGSLILAADPTANLGAATKQYVDNQLGQPTYGDNRIINGDMRILQRGGLNGNGTGGFYTLDRWYFYQPSNHGAFSQGSSAGTGFSSSLAYTSNGVYTPAATEAWYFYQPIEADMITDFQFGTPYAQPVTLSFWAYSNQAGTFSGCLQSGGGASAHAYPFTYTLPAAVWKYITINIPPDTGGTWTLSGNGIGVQLFFDLGSGANYRGPANAWTTGNLIGANGAIQLTTINGAAFNVTGVKLEVGSVATPYNRNSPAKNLADCQRYFCSALGIFSCMFPGGNVTSGATYYGIGKFPTQMRVAPTTVTLTNSGANGFPSAIGSVLDVSPIQFLESRVANATGAGYFGSGFTAQAEL